VKSVRSGIRHFGEMSGVLQVTVYRSLLELECCLVAKFKYEIIFCDVRSSVNEASETVSLPTFAIDAYGGCKV